ncbi:MAG: hypothetical protein KatS3mg066_3838 [Fischerella sp.]|nr:MAG: hypothetical protein KatS3mg066_3838 [Fischerella sp.]
MSYLGLTSSDGELPLITGLREEDINGNYALILEFDSSAIPIEIWQQKQEKMVSYFGPGVNVEVTQSGENIIELTLIAATK